MPVLIQNENYLKLYLDYYLYMLFCQVSNKRKEKIAFTINKVINVESPQPASVSVYEYYSTGEKRHNPSLSLCCTYWHRNTFVH